MQSFDSEGEEGVAGMVTSESALLELVEVTKIVPLQPGDVVAILCGRKITKEQAEMLRAQGEAAFPGHRVLVLPPELDVAVIREPDPVDG